MAIEQGMGMLNRRDFLAVSGAGLLAPALPPKSHAAPVEWRNRQTGMAYRRLGRTGFMVSEIVMGCP